MGPSYPFMSPAQVLSHRLWSRAVPQSRHQGRHSLQRHYSHLILLQAPHSLCRCCHHSRPTRRECLIKYSNLTQALELMLVPLSPILLSTLLHGTNAITLRPVTFCAHLIYYPSFVIHLIFIQCHTRWPGPFIRYPIPHFFFRHHTSCPFFYLISQNSHMYIYTHTELFMPILERSSPFHINGNDDSSQPLPTPCWIVHHSPILVVSMPLSTLPEVDNIFFFFTFIVLWK